MPSLPNSRYNATPWGKANVEAWGMAGAVGKIYKERGERWFIRLPGRIKILCDKEHRSFYSRKHAEWCLAQIQGEIENGTFDQDFYAKTRKSIQSFQVYAEHWLAICERRVERGDLSRDYFGHVRHYVRDLFVPAFGHLNMLDIRGKHIREFHLSLDRAPKTIFNVMNTLHKLFADAVEDEIILKAPNFPKELRISNIPEPDWKWCDEKVQDAIFAHLDPEALFFILFQACHGTRTGETRALQHHDIDCDNDNVTIRRAFSGSDLRHTKSKRIRVVPLDPVWKEMYTSRPRQINQEQFVFLRSGKPFSRTWAWRKWTEACQKAGVSAISLYAGTRHSLASQAANRGVSLYVISKFLGHSNLSVTARYSHLDTNPLRQVQRQATVITLESAKCPQTEK